jgi:hypothetical protein
MFRQTLVLAAFALSFAAAMPFEEVLGWTQFRNVEVHGFQYRDCGKFKWQWMLVRGEIRGPY